MGKREERKRSEVAGAQREANLAGMNGEDLLWQRKLIWPTWCWKTLFSSSSSVATSEAGAKQSGFLEGFFGAQTTLITGQLRLALAIRSKSLWSRRF